MSAASLPSSASDDLSTRLAKLPPDHIFVEQDSDGFWTCREAVSGSPKYIRADLIPSPTEPSRRETVGVTEEMVERLFNQIYANTVIKYDPEAGKRCIRAALARTSPEGGVAKEARVKVPSGQTPLNDRLGHRYLDVLNEGSKARDTGTGSPYHGHSLEHCLHAHGWVSRDLRIALDNARPEAALASPPAQTWEGIETAPKDGTAIDVWAFWPEHGISYRVTDARWLECDGRGGWVLNGHVDYGYAYPPQVTHWRARPLPPVPAGEGK